MDPVELLQALMDLAREAGLAVRVVGRNPGAEPDALIAPRASAVCKIRGQTCVVIASSDPLTGQLEVLTDAVKTHAAEYLGSHYLPPALREYLGDPSDFDAGGG